MTAIVQRSFSGGEITPSLYGRVDTTKYATGLRTCRNFTIMRHGGASNRPGFEFIAEIKNSSNTVAIIPFIFNSDQTYVLEFGPSYMRVHRNGSPVEVSGVSAYAGGTAYAIGALVSSSGVNYYCIQAGTGHTPASSPTYWYALTGNIYEIPTPYVEADLAGLKYIQSADVIVLTHKNYRQRELARSGHTAWTLTEIVLAPSQAAPTSVSGSGTAGSGSYTYHVTAVNAETFEESYAGVGTVASVTAPETNAINVTWTAASGAGQYNVYRVKNGVAGFIGVATGTAFSDTGYTPDTTDTPPVARDPFVGAGNYPAVATYIQQRLGFANLTNATEKIYLGKTANFKNFSYATPLQDDDAVTFNMAGRQVNAVQHMIDLGKLIVLTSGGEWSIEGDDAGIIRPGAINPIQRSYNGASPIPPIIIGNSALFVQARGTIIRDLMNDAIEGYKGNDLTIFSAHMFDGYSIDGWAYQQIPHSIVWVVRDDGSLLGLTYVKEQAMVAWHRHDTDGELENVCVVPEGNEDRLYAVIKRTIDGTTKRYIERMHSRQIDDIVDAVFLDSSLTYDGRNDTPSHTMTITGSGWTHDDTLTITSSASFFSAGDVGNEIHLTDSDGTKLRCEIVGYSSVTAVTVKPHKTVPVTMRDVAISTWGRAVDQLSGFEHLEGKEVGIFADGFVVASPNNDSYAPLSISSGAVTLEKCYVVIHVGIPFISDLETLNVDSSSGETVADKKQLINKVSILVEASRGIFAGGKPPADDDVDPLQGLMEYKGRENENYDDSTELKTDVIDINIESSWNSNGRVFIRQVDPLPLSVLTVVPAGLVPFRG
jgi:hypothetical protein